MKILHPVFLLAACLALPGAAACAGPARAAAAPAATTAASANPLEDARRLYDAAKFQDAIDVLGRALHDGAVTGDDVIQARALRARCLVKAGRRLEAKEAFKTVLRSDRRFTLNATDVPPDEMDSFRLAAQEIDSELLEAGRRFPASIAITGGIGNAVNQDLVDLASSAGVPPADDFKDDTEFGYSVRFPLRPRLSIDFEVSWLKATTEDKLPSDRNAHTKYRATAMPVLVSLVKNLSASPTRHVSAFVGAGPLICQAILEDRNSLVAGRVIPTQIVGRNQGWALAAGIEGEQMLQPRLALTGQARMRYANSGDLHWLRDDYEIYESYSASRLGKRSIDFSGFAASVGVRAYIGY